MNIIVTQNASGTVVEYTFDMNGQMSTLKALLTSGYQETKRVYDITSPIVSNDVLLEMRYPDTSSGNASSTEKDAFTCNNLGEVLTKTDRNGNVHTFTHDILGRRTVDAVTTLGSGVDGSIRRVEANYDTQGNVYQITTYNVATSGSVVNQIQRGYNGLGQMTVEYQAVDGSVNTGSTPKVQWAYSEMASSANHSRLNTITYPNGRVLTHNYAMRCKNALGNFDSQSTNGTAVSCSHNKQNEITNIAGATTPTYDANGSLTTDETGQTYKYDAWNRTIEVKNSGGTTIATNEYDGTTRRVQEVRNSITSDLYYSDQWQVLEERISGNTRDSYAWSPVYVDALIARDRDSDTNGSLDERLYAMQDANFNMTGLVNTSGTVVERYQLDAYGTPTYLDGSFGSRGSSSYAFNYLHQGGRRDSELGEYAFGYRQLRPEIGLWNRVDPIGINTTEVNLYRYTANSPTDTIDPSGLAYLDINLSIGFGIVFVVGVQLDFDTGGLHFYLALQRK